MSETDSAPVRPEEGLLERTQFFETAEEIEAQPLELRAVGFDQLAAALLTELERSDRETGV